LELKIVIKELEAKVGVLQEQVNNEIERKQKKKEAAERKRKMQDMREESLTLSTQRVTSRSTKKKNNVDDAYMVTGPKKTKVSDLSKFLTSDHPVRSTLEIDQRGSTHTAALDRRNKLKLSNGRHSYATASVASDSRSLWSFHPEINRNSKWKPKYDDHHDHEQLWNRMHDENRKIMVKKRLMSEEKQRSELEQCTFTPKLVTKKNQLENKTIDPEALGDRLYNYAEKLKENLTKKKEYYEQERGHEMSFTPKICTTKAISKNSKSNNRNVFLDLYEGNNSSQKYNKDHKGSRTGKAKQKTNTNTRSPKTVKNTSSFVKTIYLKGKFMSLFTYI